MARVSCARDVSQIGKLLYWCRSAHGVALCLWQIFRMAQRVAGVFVYGAVWWVCFLRCLELALVLS